MDLSVHHRAAALRRRTTRGYDSFEKAPLLAASEPIGCDAIDLSCSKRHSSPFIPGDAAAQAPGVSSTQAAQVGGGRPDAAPREDRLRARLRRGGLAYAVSTPCAERPIPLEPRSLEYALRAASVEEIVIDGQGNAHGIHSLGNSCDASKIGVSVVNDGRGGAEVHAYLVDPILFHDKRGRYNLPYSVYADVNDLLARVLRGISFGMRPLDRGGRKESVAKDRTFVYVYPELGRVSAEATREMMLHYKRNGVAPP